MKKGTNRRDMMSDVDFNLSQTGKTQNKSVSFAAKTKVAKMGQAHVKDGIEDIKLQLDQIRERTLQVQGGVTEGFAVEDSKLLEAIMEHILFHWDDIMACLVDELIEEEVLEMNRIEQIRSGQDPEEKARQELIDMLFEKKRYYQLDAPDLGLHNRKEL